MLFDQAFQSFHALGEDHGRTLFQSGLLRGRGANLFAEKLKDGGIEPAQLCFLFLNMVRPQRGRAGTGR